MIHLTIERRDVFHEGLWCIADIDTPEYTAAEMASQANLSQESQEVYAKYIVYFFVVIITVFICKRIVYMLVDKSSKEVKTNTNLIKLWYYKICAINRWICYRRFPSFICGVFQLPSSMGNFLLIMSGCLYILCCVFIPNIWYRECGGFGSPPLAARGAMGSIALVPFIFILSGKTNIISQLIGVSYEKLNVYHRWVSLMCCLLGWVHTIPFYIQAVKEGGSSRLAWSQKTNDFFKNGIPPLVFLTILTIFSHSYVRMVWYELWLQIHWICAIGFYISLFYHCHSLNTPYKYMIATIVFWVIQLSWRALNKAFLRPNRGFLRSNHCKIRRYFLTNEREHYYEVIIENSNEFSWAPGQHLFLRVPGLRFLENHPFSIISFFEPRKNTDIKLIIKTAGWGGMTRYIDKTLSDIYYTDSSVYVDGPYGGCERSVGAFDCVFLLASGTGISAVLPFLLESCKSINDNDSVTKFVHLDWIIRNVDSIKWIISELKNITEKYYELFETNNVYINIYIKESIELGYTEISNILSSKMNYSSSEEEMENPENTLIMLNFINKRPSIKELINGSINKLKERNIFIVSGSDSMKVESSNNIAHLQTEILKYKSHVNEIYLHSESFGW